MPIVPVRNIDADYIEAPPRTRSRRPKSTDYEVGYGKPPKQTQFKPGQSGNPKGRPKHSKGIKTIVREVMQKPVAIRTAKGVRKVSHAKMLIYKAVEKASKGDTRSLQLVLSLYQQAVPDAPFEEQHEQRDEDVSATDIATLEAYRAKVMADLSASDGEGARP